MKRKVFMYTYEYVRLYQMRVVNFSNLRANLKQELDRVLADSDVTIVARNGEGNNVVLMSEQQYRSLTETEYLMASPANKVRLLTALAEVKQGQILQRNIDIDIDVDVEG